MAQVSTPQDIGMMSGAYELLRQELFLDYTIQVEKEEFHVHKFVLLAASDYFRALMSADMSNQVRLKGFKASSVSKMIKLIYTGDRDIIKKNASEMLNLAMYLQIRPVVKACTNSIMSGGLSIYNCLKMLHTLTTYNLKEQVSTVKAFIRTNWVLLFQRLDHEHLSYEEMTSIVECWAQGEYDLAGYIIAWMNLDSKNRKRHADKLLTQVRFSVMERGEIFAIKLMDRMIDAPGLWWRLVNMAETYLEMPIYKRMLDRSLQATVRNDYVPVLFFTHELQKKLDRDGVHTIDDHGHWHKWKQDGTHAPLFSDLWPIVECVNNFLVVCSGAKVQRWDVFDPRTMTWHELPNMPTVKHCFSLNHIDNKLYAIGGHTGTRSQIEILSDSIEQFTLNTGTWETVAKLPFGVAKQGSCVFEGDIYISGGTREVYGRYTPTFTFYQIDVKTGKATKKSSMPDNIDGHKYEIARHQIHVMTVHGRRVIMVFYPDMMFYYFHPDNNQWTRFRHNILCTKLYHVKWCEKTTMYVHGNVVYFVNCLATEHDGNLDPDGIYWYKESAVRWEFQENSDQDNIVERFLDKFKWNRSVTDSGQVFGAVLGLHLGCLHHEGYRHS